MNTLLVRLLGALAAVALFASACGSDAATTTTDDTAADTAMDDEAMDMDDMDHGDDHATTIDVDPSLPIPAVSIELTETDTAGLFDITVELTNFTVTPENVDGDPVDNEGHMHVLIDGVKIERFTELTHQVQVPDGEHLVEVELNANNHAAYAIDGEPIRAGATVTGSGEAMAMDNAAGDDHDHDHASSNPAVEDGLAMTDAAISVNASFDGGSVTLDGDDRIEAATGDVVAIMVTSDVAEQAHLHGYDILVDVEPGETAMMLFTADTPGKFEIEFESSGVFIAELTVS